MADHHPLGRAGRTRRVDERGQVIGADPFRYAVDQPRVVGQCRTPPRYELIPRHHPIGSLVILRTLHQHDMVERLQIRLGRLPALHVFEVLDNGDSYPAMIRLVLDLGRCQSVVERDGHPGRKDRCQIGYHVLGTVGRHDGHEIAVLEAD